MTLTVRIEIIHCDGGRRTEYVDASECRKKQLDNIEKYVLFRCTKECQLRGDSESGVWFDGRRIRKDIHSPFGSDENQFPNKVSSIDY